MKRVTVKELEDAISRLPPPEESFCDVVSFDVRKPEPYYINGPDIPYNMPVSLIRFIKSDDKQSWELLAIGGL